MATCSQGMALGYISEQNPNPTGLRGGYVGGRQTGGPSPSPLLFCSFRMSSPRHRSDRGPRSSHTFRSSLPLRPPSLLSHLPRPSSTLEFA